MMLKINKTLVQRAMAPVGLGLLVLGGFALFHALTYIPDETFAATEGNATVSVNVQSVLTLTVSPDANSGNAVEITADNSKIATGRFTAKVSSNQAYRISLSAKADDGSTTALTRSGSSESIPAVEAGKLVTAGTSSWGVRTCVDGNASYLCTATNNVSTGGNPYKAIGAPNVLVPFYESAMGVQEEVTTYEVGIGVDSNLSSGVYATTIAVTAAQY